MPPTFGVPHGLVVGLIAGGPGALLKAVEGAEDSQQAGEDDLVALNLQEQDLVVGLAASGRTPYVIGGLRYARQSGCTTVAVSCNPDSPIAREANIAISPVVGPEALTGSTRLKSGTAQKMVLNMISTGAMVKFGKVYQNLMVDMKATNVKLVDRACRMVVEATGIGREEAETLLKQTDFEVKPAILMALTGWMLQPPGKTRRSSGLFKGGVRTLKRCVWIRRQRSPATFYVVSAESKIFCARKTV